jgi:uncharacterized membrane protein
VNNRLAYIFILLTCIGYTILGWNVSPNSDERASIVIALGQHPSIISTNGSPISETEYFGALNYKKYQYSDVRLFKVVQSVINDNSNGLVYYLLLAGWIKVFGLSVLGMRILSILIAGINLGILYNLAGQLKIGRSFRFLMLIHAAISLIFFADAILIRSYMLALTGGLLASFYLWKILLDYTKRSYFVWYFFGVILAIGSHYYITSFFVAHMILVGWKITKDKGAFAPFLVGYGIMAGLCLFWMWLSYPSGWRNLAFFYNRVRLISEGTGYDISFVHYLKQLLYYSSNILGVGSMELFSKSFMKVLSGGILFSVVVLLLKYSNSLKGTFMISLTIMPLIFYTIQPLFAGNFTNFIPHYVVLFIPYWLLALYGVLEDSFHKIKPAVPHKRAKGVLQS